MFQKRGWKKKEKKKIENEGVELLKMEQRLKDALIINAKS